jgi:hypothetical protein
MTSIGGPGGIDGPKGPGAIDAADEADALEAPDATAGPAATAAASGTSDIDALAADVAAGRLTPHEAIDRLVEATAAGLDAAERAELREMITDLVANDPYLTGLAGRI